MSTESNAADLSASNVPSAQAGLPIFSRKATGLVREVSLLQMVVYNATSTNPLGLGLVFFSFALVLFPRCNPYVAIPVAGVLCLFVWATYALLTAAIPRVGGDYTINTRILPPWLALGGNLAQFISAFTAGPLFAYWFSTLAISPALSLIGSVTHSSRLVRWGTDFSPSHHNVVFVTTVFGVVLISALASISTRVVVRFMTTLMLLATAGLIVDMIILLFTSHSSFVSTVDSAAGHGTYAKTVAAGAKQGLFPDDGGYSTKSTIGAIYYAMTVTVWAFWGTYLSSEFKGAGQRRRQLTAMVGTGVGQVISLCLALFIFTSTVGYDFFVSALNGNYTNVGNGAVGSAGYVYFAALVASNKALVILLALVFTGWFLPAVFINLSMPHRALLTWSFDGLLPRGMSKVNDRSHTPVRAILTTLILTIPFAAWIAYSSNAFQYIALNALYGYSSILLVGIAAAVVKWRRPELYRGSPAEWRLLGVEVLPIAGVGCAIAGAVAIALAVYFHTELGIKYTSTALLVSIGLVFVFGAVWWWLARAVRKQQGIDLMLSYKTIPPE
jgi:basic amino acid/polyamine antiporter, APA family